VADVHPGGAAGGRAVFGFPLQVGTVRLGALNLYRDRPGPLNGDQHADALVLAGVAARWVLETQAGAAPGAVAGELEAGAFKVTDAVKSVIAIENVRAAIDQIAQTTLRKVVGQHTLDQTLSETDQINLDIRKILDVTTVDWGVEVTLVELKDIQLPDTMKRAMANQAEAEREKRAKIINAEGEALAAAALGEASDTMMAHPLALQLRNLQSLVEIGVDKNTTVVFPAPLMTTIAELGSFLAAEKAAASPGHPATTTPIQVPAPNGATQAT
jgi:hypothetical protein